MAWQWILSAIGCMLVVTGTASSSHAACFKEPDARAANVVWSAGMEGGNLCEWPGTKKQETSFDSGICKRKSMQGMSHSGQRALHMMAYTPAWMMSGCRQFRYPEPRSYLPGYYSFWVYFPEHYLVRDWAQFAQFKTKSNHQNDPIWALRLTNRQDGSMAAAMTFKCQCNGPAADQKNWNGKDLTRVFYTQKVKTIPVKQWVFFEIFFDPSTPDGSYDGHVTVWQDGTLLWDFPKVITNYPGGWNSFSLTTYGRGVYNQQGQPWYELYFDDVTISRERVK